MLEWKPEYSVGVPRIDTQHRKLFEYFNELEQAMRQGKGRDVLGRVLRNLVAYTGEHFATEEDLMRRTTFPELAQHKAAHDAFVEQALSFQRRYEAGEVGLTVELISSLTDWVRNHVLGMDQRYGPHLKAHQAA